LHCSWEYEKVLSLPPLLSEIGEDSISTFVTNYNSNPSLPGLHSISSLPELKRGE
jgi:hypothetical protein